VSDAASRRRILIICHANTSRSIIAEAVLLRLLASRGMDDRFEVRSGGIAPYARDGSLVSLDARFVLRDIGIDLPEGAGATDLKRQRHLVEAADLILAMTDEQRRMLAKDFPEAGGKPVVLLRELAGESGDIADPSMQSEDVFRHCRDEIVRCLETGLARLVEG
jgi:low molecular weight protein-tyrosine phosphatase